MSMSLVRVEVHSMKLRRHRFQKDSTPLRPGDVVTEPTKTLRDNDHGSLKEGKGSLTSQSGGYVPGAFGQSRPEGPVGSVVLAEAERVTDVTI